MKILRPGRWIVSIVSISSGVMAGAETLAEILSKRLGYPAVGREIEKEAAAILGISVEIFHEQLERGPKGPKNLIKKKGAHVIALQCILADHARRGPFIYYGYAGPLLLEELRHVLKVLLISSLERRAETLSEKRKIPADQAERSIREADKRDLRVLRSLSDRDWQNPLLYDMVVNTGRFDMETVAEMVIHALKGAEFMHPSYIEDFCLASKVRCVLLSDERTRGMDIDVEARQGVVKISGRFLTSGPFSRGISRSREDVMEVVSTIPGVEKVELNIHGAPVPVE